MRFQLLTTLLAIGPVLATPELLRRAAPQCAAVSAACNDCYPTAYCSSVLRLPATKTSTSYAVIITPTTHIYTSDTLTKYIGGSTITTTVEAGTTQVVEGVTSSTTITTTTTPCCKTGKLPTALTSKPACFKNVPSASIKSACSCLKLFKGTVMKTATVTITASTDIYIDKGKTTTTISNDSVKTSYIGTVQTFTYTYGTTTTTIASTVKAPSPTACPTK